MNLLWVLCIVAVVAVGLVSMLGGSGSKNRALEERLDRRAKARGTAKDAGAPEVAGPESPMAAPDAAVADATVVPLPTSETPTRASGDAAA